MTSYAFAPEVGGIETVSAVLARRWTEMGHDVVVVTQTAAEDRTAFPFRVIRRPTFFRLLGLIHWADVLFQNNISVRQLLPLLLSPKPLFVTHQTWLAHLGAPQDLGVRAKFQLLRLARNIAISRRIAEHLGVAAVVQGNPYDEDTFTLDGGIETRPRDYLFVGRLVSDKGVDVFIRALGELRNRGQIFRATIAGDGPLRADLVQLARASGVEEWIEFRGTVRGRELGRCYREHRVLVVPSRWEEPFGIVALEGGACGCRVVVADSGGLPEAAGPDGIIVPKGDARALADALQAIGPGGETTGSGLHLRRHASRAVAQFYLGNFAAPLSVPVH